MPQIPYNYLRRHFLPARLRVHDPRSAGILRYLNTPTVRQKKRCIYLDGMPKYQGVVMVVVPTTRVSKKQKKNKAYGIGRVTQRLKKEKEDKRFWCGLRGIQYMPWYDMYKVLYILVPQVAFLSTTYVHVHRLSDVSLYMRIHVPYMPNILQRKARCGLYDPEVVRRHIVPSSHLDLATVSISIHPQPGWWLFLTADAGFSPTVIVDCWSQTALLAMLGYSKAHLLSCAE